MGDNIAGIFGFFIVCFFVTLILDSIFGMIPERPFADYGWIWFLKPTIWAIWSIALIRIGRSY